MKNLLFTVCFLLGSIQISAFGQNTGFEVSQKVVNQLSDGAAKFNNKDLAGASQIYTQAIEQMTNEINRVKTEINQLITKSGGTPANFMSTTPMQAIDAEFNTAIDFNKKAMNAQGQNQNQQAIDFYTEAVKHYQLGLAQIYFNRAIVNSNNKMIEPAIQDLGQAITLNPNYVDAYNNRGMFYQQIKGDPDLNSAYQDFSISIKLKPDDPTSYYNRGNLLFNLQMDKEAIKDYDEAIKLKSNYAEAWNMRGLVKLVIAQVKEGCVDLKQAENLGLKLGLDNWKKFCAPEVIKKTEEEAIKYNKNSNGGGGH